jgi:hypothetical protein
MPAPGQWFVASSRDDAQKFIDEPVIPFQSVRHMPASKDTPKAITIIVLALGVLAALLAFANHIRPHP